MFQGATAKVATTNGNDGQPDEDNPVQGKDPMKTKKNDDKNSSNLYDIQEIKISQASMNKERKQTQIIF